MLLRVCLLWAVGAATGPVTPCPHCLGQQGVCRTAAGSLGDLSALGLVGAASAPLVLCTALRRPVSDTDPHPWYCPRGYTPRPINWPLMNTVPRYSKLHHSTLCRVPVPCRSS